MNAPSRDHARSSSNQFERRHIGPSAHEIDAMLNAVGAASMEELIAQTIPADIRRSMPRSRSKLRLSETEALARLRDLAGRNAVFTSLIGQGYYGTILPPVIQRNVLENPAWYTAYTPYQPEISQGRLEALLNYQTLIRDLTGLDIANASLLDEATAAAEAMALAKRAAGSKSNRFFIDRELHPQTIAVLRTRAEPLGMGPGARGSGDRPGGGGHLRRFVPVSGNPWRDSRSARADPTWSTRKARSPRWRPTRWR